MINILLDTNIIRQEGFESQQIQLLVRLVQGAKANLYIPDMVRREFLTQKGSETQENLHKIVRNIDKIQRAKLFNGQHNEELNQISKSLKNITNEITKEFAESFQNWISKMKATIIDVDPLCLENILDDYFSGKNAFRHPKSRNDFPDAIILAAIIDILEEIDSLYVVLNDGHFKECLNRFNNISTVSTLKKLFTFPEVDNALTELDAESKRIQSIKKYLASEDCKERLEDFLSSDQSDIAIGYWDENEISDPDEILELKMISAYIEEIDSKEIDNLTFGKINYLGEESYSIEYSFTTTVELNLLTDYGDYIHLEEEHKKQFEFVSADDGICELKISVECNFVGSIELLIAEKLKPEELAIHFQYLDTDQSPIFASTEFNKIIIISI